MKRTLIMTLGIAASACASGADASLPNAADGGTRDARSAGGGGGFRGAGGASTSAPTTDEDSGAVIDAASNAAGTDLAKACAADSDCGGALRCLKDSDRDMANGGPAHGYCTARCTTASDCERYGGICVNTAATESDPFQGFCLTTCDFGTESADKCHGRTDVGCQIVNSTTQAAACVPICSQDSDCPTGRKCDPKTSVCVDNPTAGDGLGAHCEIDFDAGTSNCAGDCIKIGSSTSTLAWMCSNRCVVGQLDACNSTEASLSSGGTHGTCAFSTATAAVGDVGHCAQQCDQASDCNDVSDPGVYCDQTFNTAASHGHCYWDRSSPDGGPVARDAATE